MLSQVHDLNNALVSKPYHWTKFEIEASKRGKQGGGREKHLNNALVSKPQPWAYRGTSLIRKCTPLGPYRRPVPRVLGET